MSPAELALIALFEADRAYCAQAQVTDDETIEGGEPHEPIPSASVETYLSLAFRPRASAVTRAARPGPRQRRSATASRNVSCAGNPHKLERERIYLHTAL